MPRFIDNFRVVVLDMGHTFMFECDRFGKGNDYFQTYTHLGGTGLTATEVESAIEVLFSRLVTDSRNPECIDDFGSVADYLRTVPETACLSDAERELLEDVFAHHEVGTISETHANTLHRLRKTHPLGLISNIWARRPVFEAALERVGVINLFDILVWSSDHGCIKPSRHLFQTAISHFDLPAEQMVYVGDNPECDMVGAKAAGMGAVWIRHGERQFAPALPQPDLIVTDLNELLTA